MLLQNGTIAFTAWGSFRALQSRASVITKWGSFDVSKCRANVVTKWGNFFELQSGASSVGDRQFVTGNF